MTVNETVAVRDMNACSGLFVLASLLSKFWAGNITFEATVTMSMFSATNIIFLSCLCWHASASLRFRLDTAEFHFRSLPLSFVQAGFLPYTSALPRSNGSFNERGGVLLSYLIKTLADGHDWH